MRIFLAFIFAILIIPGALAQENSIDSLASQMAKAISKSKQKSVVVFDFVGPDQKLNALGQKLADDFSSAMEKSNVKFSVVNRMRVRDELRKSYAILSAPQDFDTLWNLAQVLGTQAFITGELSIKEGNLLVEVDSFRSEDGKQIKELEVVLPLTEEMNTLRSEAVGGKQTTVAPANPPSPPKGRSFSPTCLVCPNARYTDAAIKAKVTGTVTLIAVIGLDGRAHQIRVVKGLPFGLTDSAIEAVRTWVFKPATGADGNPIVVGQAIEVTFHLSSR
jgi:TonB family protein